MGKEGREGGRDKGREGGRKGGKRKWRKEGRKQVSLLFPSGVMGEERMGAKVGPELLKMRPPCSWLKLY